MSGATITRDPNGPAYQWHGRGEVFDVTGPELELLATAEDKLSAMQIARALNRATTPAEAVPDRLLEMIEPGRIARELGRIGDHVAEVRHGQPETLEALLGIRDKLNTANVSAAMALEQDRERADALLEGVHGLDHQLGRVAQALEMLAEIGTACRPFGKR